MIQRLEQRRDVAALAIGDARRADDAHLRFRSAFQRELPQRSEDGAGAFLAHVRLVHRHGSERVGGEFWCGADAEDDEGDWSTSLLVVAGDGGDGVLDCGEILGSTRDDGEVWGEGGRGEAVGGFEEGEELGRGADDWESWIVSDVDLRFG